MRLRVYTAEWTPSSSWNLPFPCAMSWMSSLCPIFRNAIFFFYCYCVIALFVFVTVIWTSCSAFLSYVLLCENVLRKVRNGKMNQGCEDLGLILTLPEDSYLKKSGRKYQLHLLCVSGRSYEKINMNGQCKLKSCRQN